MGMTKEEYESRIPECCTVKTFEEHRDYLMFCWGILADIVNKDKECDPICDYHKDYKKEIV